MVPYLHMRGEFIAVDVFSSRARGRVRLLLRIISECSTLLFAALTLYGFQLFLSVAGPFTTPAMGIPNWVFYCPALVGIAFLTLASVVRVVDLLRGRLPDNAAGELS